MNFQLDDVREGTTRERHYQIDLNFWQFHNRCVRKKVNDFKMNVKEKEREKEGKRGRETEIEREREREREKKKIKR